MDYSTGHTSTDAGYTRVDCFLDNKVIAFLDLHCIVYNVRLEGIADQNGSNRIIMSMFFLNPVIKLRVRVWCVLL